MELGNSISNVIMDSKEKFNSVNKSIYISILNSVRTPVSNSVEDLISYNITL